MNLQHHYKVILFILTIGTASTSDTVLATSQKKTNYTTQSNVMIPMTDETFLAADVYIPEGVTSAPTVLTRTPYSKNSKSWLVEPLVEAGFAVVMQDVRGMGQSEGTFIPFVFDKSDGLDTLDWIADQKWCDGNIGMWGSSYLGYCAMILAPEKHPNLKAIFNVSGWGNSYEMTTPGGAIHLMAAAPWTFSQQIRGKGSFSSYHWDDVFKHIPVVEMPKALGIESPQWDGMMQLYTGNDLQVVASIHHQYNQYQVPTFHITGWNDFVGRHTLDVYEGVDQQSKQTAQRLIVGPWKHDQIWRTTTTVGDEDFGPQMLMGVEKVMQHSIRWFDRWLRGNRNGVTREKKVKVFVMGENTWREFDQWPPENTGFQKWYLGSGGKANSLSGDGNLSTTIGTDADYDVFQNDPLNPVPTTGGVNFHFFENNIGIKDQRAIEKRNDVLVYTSSSVQQDIDLIGPLKAVVYASTTGKSADVTVKLVEVRSDGYARIIEDGIKRNPDSIAGKDISLMEPGKVYPFTVDLGATGIHIKKGHLLRVEVSAGNFPKYTRNPNNGDNPERTDQFITTAQTIHHTKQYPSHIVLPILKP